MRLFGKTAMAVGLVGLLLGVFYSYTRGRQQRIAIAHITLRGGDYLHDDVDSVFRLDVSPEVVCFGSRGSESTGSQVIHRRHRATDQDIIAILPLYGIKQLDLSNSLITNSGAARLRTFSRLERLYLDGSQISDDGLLALAAIPELQTVDVSRTNVTPQAVERFRQLRPEIDLEYSAIEQATEGM